MHRHNVLGKRAPTPHVYEFEKIKRRRRIRVQLFCISNFYNSDL